MIELLAQFVHVGEHLPLLVLEALELAADVFALRVGAGFLQGCLQFAQALVQVLLPLGQGLEAVGGLQLLALPGSGRGGGLALGFVAVFLGGHFELFELAAAGLAGTAAAAAVARARNGEIVRDHFQQRLVSRLLGGDGRGQLRRRFFRLLQRRLGPLHFLDGRLERVSGLRILGALQRLARLLQRLFLRFSDGGKVGSEVAGKQREGAEAGGGHEEFQMDSHGDLGLADVASSCCNFQVAMTISFCISASLMPVSLCPCPCSDPWPASLAAPD